MGRGRRWERWEDDLIVEAATGNRVLGLTQTAVGDVEAARDAESRQPVTDERGYIRRLGAVAQRTNRTYDAVRQRAHRLGKRSYKSRQPEPEYHYHPFAPGMTMTDDEILARMQENERMYQPFHETED